MCWLQIPGREGGREGEREGREGEREGGIKGERRRGREKEWERFAYFHYVHLSMCFNFNSFFKGFSW